MPSDRLLEFEARDNLCHTFHVFFGACLHELSRILMRFIINIMSGKDKMITSTVHIRVTNMRVFISIYADHSFIVETSDASFMVETSEASSMLKPAVSRPQIENGTRHTR